jgi:hypothetical protein
MEGLTELREVCLRNTQALVSVAAEPKERIQTSIPNMSLMSYAEAEVLVTQRHRQRPALFAAGWAVVRGGGAWVVLRGVGRLGAAFRVLHCGQC